MIKSRKWLIFTVSALCLTMAILSLAFVTSAGAGKIAFADNQQNVLRMSDGTTTLETSLAWTYGDNNIFVGKSFRSEHGNTVYYTLSKDSEEMEEFAAVFNGNTQIFYEVENNVATTTPFKAQTLNDYFKTLKAGAYSLTVSVPAGSVDASHTHWYDSSLNGTCTADTYDAVTHTVSLKVTAYEITNSNLGKSDSTNPNVTLKYTVKNPEVIYTGNANNLPEIDLTFTSGGTTVLVEGEDYELSSTDVNVGNASLTITGIGGFTGSVTIANAYSISMGENVVSDVHVILWRYGEFNRNINLFSVNAKWGTEDELHFAISNELLSSSPFDENANFIEGLEDIQLTDGMVSTQVEAILNTLDARKPYYLYASVESNNNNYSSAWNYTRFEIVEVTNTWKTTPNVVSWSWGGFNPDINSVNAVPSFGDSVTFSIYTKNGSDYTALQFGGQSTFTLEEDEQTGLSKLPANVINVLSGLDAGTYYLFASVISGSDNYSDINAEFDESALVPFRVLKATNYWTQIPKIQNWSYGGYDSTVNVISASAAYGGSSISYSIYMQTEGGIGIMKFGDTVTFTLSNGNVPEVVAKGLSGLHAGRYYLRATVAGTDNYTGLQETVGNFTDLSAFDVIKADNYWTTAPAINAWSEGGYNNDDNMPVAVAHFGTVRIIITDVNDEENILYDNFEGINNLASAGVGAYLLTATVTGTADYDGMTFDTLFHVFVPETEEVGIPWWLVLIIVVCSLGALVFIFWLLHEKGILQMITGQMIVKMRTKATMDATIAAVRANKKAEEAKESVRLAEELDKLEMENVEAEEDDSSEDVGILISTDESTGLATYVRYQRPFSVKLMQVSDEVKEYYSRLKNVLLSYAKVKSKVSNGFDAFRKGRTQIAKLVIRGKTLCLYLALDPADYEESKYRVEKSESKKFAEVPCLYRIKSARRVKYAEELIAQLCEKLEIRQGDIPNVDYKPKYQSTEKLLEKGLIKKIFYTRKYDPFAKNENETVKPKKEEEPETEFDETEQEPETEPVTEESIETVTDTEPATEEATESASETETESEKEEETETALEPESEPQTEPQTEQEFETEEAPELEETSETEEEVATDLEPETALESATEQASETDVEPETEPESETETESEPATEEEPVTETEPESELEEPTNDSDALNEEADAE